jgi:hypothetical protein
VLDVEWVDDGGDLADRVGIKTVERLVLANEVRRNQADGCRDGRTTPDLGKLRKTLQGKDSNSQPSGGPGGHS